jgi:hypothetical protein
MTTKQETLETTLKTATSKNVYCLQKKEGDNLCVVWKRISCKPFRALGEKADLFRERFKIICYGNTYKEASELGLLVFNKLDGNTTNFNTAVCIDFYDGNKDIASNLYSVVYEFFIW